MTAAAHSLADFYFSDSSDPLRAPSGYARWRHDGEWATRLYEPALLDGPAARTRILVGGEERAVINLASYNYLGLSREPRVVAAAQQALLTYGTGACGSPLLSGKTHLHTLLEAELAAHFGREAVLLFNSGFAGGMGTLAGLLRKGDVAVLDEKCHVSLVEGAKLSRARLEMFAHNDAQALDEVLRKHAGKRRLVVVEGVYSMDGDMADLPRLMEVARQHECGVMIDEAHSVGAWGENGRGIGEHLGAHPDLLFATFSKSFAGLGSFVAGDADTLEYLRYFANPYGFSCALPPSVVAALLAALRIIAREPQRRQTLQDNARYFCTELVRMGINTGNSVSQVIPIIVGGDRELLYRLGNRLIERGLFMAPVDYPSVPEGQLRFRASITAAHRREDLDQALQIIADTVAPEVVR